MELERRLLTPRSMGISNEPAGYERAIYCYYIVVCVPLHTIMLVYGLSVVLAVFRVEGRCVCSGVGVGGLGGLVGLADWFLPILGALGAGLLGFGFGRRMLGWRLLS